MNKKFRVFLSICLFLTLIYTGYHLFRTESTNSFFMTDSNGERVILTKKPQNVAVLTASLCNVWANAGGEISITVGESVERGLCDKNVKLVDSGAGKSINTELLISYRPDFVIYSSDIPAQKDCADILKKSGIPAVSVRLDSFEDYLSTLKSFCDITGKAENADLYGEKQQEEINMIKQNALSQNRKAEILFVRSGSNISSFKAKTAKDNFVAKMLEELGCVNIADSALVLLDGISAEIVLKENPEYIFISLMGDEESGKRLTEDYFADEAFSTLTSKIIYLPKELFQYKPCENWAKAYKFLYEKLYG